MPQQNHSIFVKVLEKMYQVKCPAENAHELQEAAHFLDKKMREIRDVGNIIGSDRIAVIAALNIAHSLLRTEKKENKHIDVVLERIRDMQQKAEGLLNQQEQIEF